MGGSANDGNEQLTNGARSWIGCRKGCQRHILGEWRSGFSFFSSFLHTNQTPLLLSFPFLVILPVLFSMVPTGVLWEMEFFWS